MSASLAVRRVDICVIGGGAIGKTAALALAQAGHEVALLSAPVRAEAEPASWDVRVFALNHVARDLLSRLRVWDAMDASRIAPVEFMSVNGDGAHAGQLKFDAYGAHVNSLTWIVEDRNLAQALDGALRFAPKLHSVTGQALSMAVEAESARVTLQDGSVIECALIVGADGAQSWVRGQCDIGYDFRSYGQRGVVCNFDCERAHHGVAHQWFTSDQGIVALLPLPGQRVSLVWSAPDALAETLMRESHEAMAERLAHWAEPVLGRLTPMQPLARRAFPLSILRPHAMIAPRVALVGDAAHVVHPLAGHGMNLGFGDVAELERHIAARESHRDPGDAKVLARYARSRKEDVLLMQLATDGLERLFSLDFEPVRLMRNAGLNLLDRLPVLKRQLIGQALGK